MFEFVCSQILTDLRNTWGLLKNKRPILKIIILDGWIKKYFYKITLSFVMFIKFNLIL